MTNDELNLYIKHYLEKDKTGRAIMLTGAWGIGKSYYIKNSLIPFLKKAENGSHDCIVVSLYGMSSLNEISKAVYFESVLQQLSNKPFINKISGKKLDATANTVLTIAKTAVKGLTGKYGFDLSINEKDVLKLCKLMNLSHRLIIFEDVERSDIGILQILGYVNNLVEQDGVKVLLVTNENEIIQYEQIHVDSGNTEQHLLAKIKNDRMNRQYTQETQEYLEIKEKTVGDTIVFTGDLPTAIIQIIQGFENDYLNRYCSSEYVDDILSIMALRNNCNLRSFIFACQKTVDIYEKLITVENLSVDYLRTIFFGILFFSLRLKAGAEITWNSPLCYSIELGNSQFPLFRFCYDYIVNQKINLMSLPETINALEKLRRYDSNKSNGDKEIQALYAYSIHTEKEVRQAFDSINQRLDNPEDIAFAEYGKIAAAIVSLKYFLDINISDMEEKLVRNIKGEGYSIDEASLFRFTITNDDEDVEKEYADLRKRMILSLKDMECFIPGFDYKPEQAEIMNDFVVSQTGRIYSEKGFMRFLDASRLATMFVSCSPEQMSITRNAFRTVYKAGNIKEFFADDLQEIKKLRLMLEGLMLRTSMDRIQQIQCGWFYKNLSDIIDRLS